MIVQRLGAGDEAAAGELLPLVYAELKAMAVRCMRDERAGHTLQATALVHEVYLRLVGDGAGGYEGRAHFLGVAAVAMRRLLVDHARKRGAERRGGGRQRVDLADAAQVGGDVDSVDLVALDAALRRLAELDARKAQVVELRFFGGLSNEDVAQVIGAARSTVAEDWRFARAWLAAELRGEEA